jgi:transcriptional regulator with XRE-family HTH domain
VTGAEYRTTREACGLSQQAAADFHRVGLRTIAHWETERNRIPAGAADELRGLNASIARGVDEALNLYRELLAEHGPAEAVALTRYRSAEDYAGSRAHRDGLPWASHCALIMRTMLALERAGASVAIAWAA